MVFKQGINVSQIFVLFYIYLLLLILLFFVFVLFWILDALFRSVPDVSKKWPDSFESKRKRYFKTRF